MNRQFPLAAVLRTALPLLAVASAACSRRRAVEAAPRPITASPLQLHAATAEESELSRGKGRAVELELGLARRDEAAATGETHAGPYIVTYLITPATGYYEADPGVPAALTWHDVSEPGESHLGVVIRDTTDGRLVEGLVVRATIHPRRGASITRDLPFGWHPVLNRYGENLRLPSSTFSLRISIDTAWPERRDAGAHAREITASFSKVGIRAGAIERAAQRVAAGDDLEARELAQEQGVWERRAIDEMLRGGLAHGERVHVHGYDATVAVERQFDVTTADTAHDAYLTLIVQDSASGRAIPALHARAQMLDRDGRVIATHELGYVRHPWLSHFGAWWRVPRDGDYVFRVHADAPTLRRYGRTTGLEFRDAIDLDSPAIQLNARSPAVPSAARR